MSRPAPAMMEQVLLDATAREADSEVTDHPRWKQVRTPSSTRPNHNKIIAARLSAPDTDEAIDEVITDHRRRGAGLSWFVGPSSTPTDLGERLTQHGLTHQGASLGMARTLGDADISWKMPGLTIRQVTSQSDVQTYAEVSMHAWQQGPKFREALTHILRQALDEQRPTRSFLASIDGDPVASSHLRLMPNCGYLQGCAVLPDRRRQGLYRALVHHRLDVLRDEGINLAVIWAAAKTSGQGCLNLGFSTVCTGNFYEFTPA